MLLQPLAGAFFTLGDLRGLGITGPLDHRQHGAGHVFDDGDHTGELFTIAQRVGDAEPRHVGCHIASFAPGDRRYRHGRVDFGGFQGGVAPSFGRPLPELGERLVKVLRCRLFRIKLVLQIFAQAVFKPLVGRPAQELDADVAGDAPTRHR